MKTKLKVLRVKEDLTQDEMAKKLGVSRQTYQAIESGERRGSEEFWLSVHGVFNVPASEMWELMQKDFTK